jgi:hypothetical protein
MTRITDAEKKLLPIHCGALRRRGEEITADLIEHVLLVEINDLTSEVERLKAVAEAAGDLYREGMCCTCTARSKAWFRMMNALAALESK